MRIKRPDVSGEIIEVNESLNDEPEKVNSDPSGEGWMIRIRRSNPSEVNRLLSADEYEDFTKGQEIE